MNLTVIPEAAASTSITPRLRVGEAITDTGDFRALTTSLVRRSTSAVVTTILWNRRLQPATRTAASVDTRSLVFVVARQRLSVWFDTLLLSVLGAAAVMTMSGSEQPRTSTRGAGP